MNATSVLLFQSLLRVWPIRVHCLIVISSGIGGVQAWLYSSSFDTFIGQCIFNICRRHFF